MSEQNNKIRISEWSNSLMHVDSGKTENSVKFHHRIYSKNGIVRIRSVNVTGDNRYLIVSFEDNPTIRVVDLEKLEYLPATYDGHTQTVRLTSITKDNKCFWTASWDGTFRKYSIASGRCLQVLSGLARSPSCFLEAEERMLFTASYDSDFNLKSKNSGWCWDLSTGKTLYSYEHKADRIHHEAIDIAMDEGGVYTGSDDGRAYRWPLRGKDPILEYFSFHGTVRKIAVTKNLFAASCTDGSIRVKNKITGEGIHHFQNDHKDLREVRISKDESTLWCASGLGSVFCYSLQSGDLLFQKTYHASWIWSIGLMNGEQILVSGGGDGQVIFQAADTGKLLARLYMFSEQSDFLITCPSDKTFPSGFFYTTNKELIKILGIDQRTKSEWLLDDDDPNYTAYYNKHNLKNLVLTRLRSSKQYDLLTRAYLKNQKLLRQIQSGVGPKRLRA